MPEEGFYKSDRFDQKSVRPPIGLDSPFENRKEEDEKVRHIDTSLFLLLAFHSSQFELALLSQLH